MSVSLYSICRSALVTVILTVALVGLQVSAATITSASDVPSTLQTGQDANHTLTFTTSSGVAESETITVTFESDFDTSSLTEDDVDITDDATDLTTAADCTGAEEASVSVAADVVTITICPGDGGAIAAASEVVIEIGSNATASGTGSNQVENPSVAGTYYVSVAGTFGDSGSIALPIGGADAITVSATVTGGGGGGNNGSQPGVGGGNPGGGNQADVIAPVIENVTVSEITETSAIISWNTDEASHSRVDYGFTTSYEVGSKQQDEEVATHTVALTDLIPGQLYHFRVRSKDISNNEAFSDDFVFTTLDLTAPIITDVQVIDITTSSARVVWFTDEAADSHVEYGRTDAHGSVRIEETLVTDHSVILTGLAQNTTYHFFVRSSDAHANTSETESATFVTLGNVSPANVSGLSVVSGNAQNALSWSNPAEVDLAGVRVLSCLDTFPDNEVDPDCDVIFDGLAESFTHTGLINDTTYFYGVFAYDTLEQFSSGALGTGTPRAPESELPEEQDPPGQEEPVDDDQEDPQQDDQPAEDQGSTCGDNVCSVDENAQVCPQDCAREELPADQQEDSDQSSGSTRGSFQNFLEFFVSARTLQLRPTFSGSIRLLSGTSARIQLLHNPLINEARQVRLTIGDETFLMRPNFSSESTGDIEASQVSEDAYVTDVLLPDRPGQYVIEVEVFGESDAVQRVALLADVVERGSVFETFDGTERFIANARVTLVQSDEVVWDGSPYGQLNPLTTDETGAFAWYVPNGTYTVRVQAGGFEDVERTIVASDHIINPSIRMTRVEDLVAVQVDQRDDEERVTLGGTPTLTSMLALGLETIREVPGIQEAAVVSTPALAVTAVASGVVLTVAFDFLPFLQYLFTSPVLFFWRRRRKGHGVVYNAMTKVPIDLAIVRLFKVAPPRGQATTPVLVRSRVTDKEGRYRFLVDPGWYQLQVTKQGFTFPSAYLKAEKTDGQFLDVYHSEPIEVTEKGATITANIPVDPAGNATDQTPAKLIWMSRLRRAQQIIAIAGVIAATGFAIIRPSMLAAGMIVIQIVLYLFVRRLVVPRKPTSWGVVYDKQTGKPLARALVRIFDPRYNKLLESRVTDARGRYSFLLGPNTYHAVFEKRGYQSKEVKPIDLHDRNRPEDFSKEIHLDHEQPTSAQ